MDKKEIRLRVKSASMVYGIYMGIFLIFKFFIDLLSVDSMVFSYMYLACLCLIPFILLYIGIQFGRKQSDCDFTYWDYFRLLFYTFFFASLIYAVALYVYLAFINPDFIQTQYNALLSTVAVLKESMPEFASYEEILQQMSAPSAVMVVSHQICAYIMVGLIFSLPLAAVVKAAISKYKKERTQQ